jgi:hypothetical protein
VIWRGKSQQSMRFQSERTESTLNVTMLMPVKIVQKGRERSRADGSISRRWRRSRDAFDLRMPPKRRLWLESVLLVALLVALGNVCAGCSRKGEREHLPANSAVEINSWYGGKQSFGTVGTPQRWINILGNVSGASVETLAYSLNGGPTVALSIGPSLAPHGATRCSEAQARTASHAVSSVWNAWRDRVHRLSRDCQSHAIVSCVGQRAIKWVYRRFVGTSPRSYPRRLNRRGDFNVELDRRMLHNGPNTVTLAATDKLGPSVTRAIEVNYSEGKLWPLPYSVDWTRAANVQRVVQVVDGQWKITPDGLRTDESGYDRLFAVGDLGWANYDITVPITIHSVDYVRSINQISGGPALGIITHWAGHTFNPVSECECSQPRCGWLPAGASGWYSFPKPGTEKPGFHIVGSINRDALWRELEIGTPYVWRLRSEPLAGGRCCNYRMKVWNAGGPEPTRWDLEGVGASNTRTRGSILLVAHHVDATFGNIAVTPVATQDDRSQ